MRSRTGCLTCRQRKLKCGEEKPKCAQCVKASRDCIPGSGITFRHQQNASMNAGESSAGPALSNYYAYKNTFDQGTSWVEIPKEVTFIHTSDPYNDVLSPDLGAAVTPTASNSSHEIPPRRDLVESVERQPISMSESHRASEAPSAAAGGTVSEHTSTPHSVRQSILSPTTVSAMPESSRSVLSPLSARSRGSEQPFSHTPVPNHNLDFILNHPTSISPPIDPHLPSPGNQSRRSYTSFSVPQSTDHLVQDSSIVESNHELGFLLRYFSEGPGLWMDLFDLGLYFSYYVPAKAADHTFLKYAAAACAAKALGRISGQRPAFGGNASQLAWTEQFPECRSVDWLHKGAEHYRTAVKLLREALHEDYQKYLSDHPESHKRHDPTEHPVESPTKRRKLSNLPSHVYRTNSDELLAATAILCVYEFLDASNLEWSGHLNGAKSLIDIAKERMMPLQRPSPAILLPPSSYVRISKARKATFWNIARQDMLAAFINETRTRLDAEDLDMWKEAGLMLDPEGLVMPSNITESGYPEGDGVMREDMISNALIWLMFRLVNYMAAGDDVPAEIGGPWLGVPQRSLLDYWHHLRRQFRVWYDGLPITFRPVLRIHPGSVPSLSLGSESYLDIPETWFSIPMCASTMQSYHMSQILLLSNKPHESTQGRTTVHARLSSYEETISESQRHSRSIVSIALNRADVSVRIHSVQPLYTAGQCLTEPGERRLILKLLRNIETDTGWATEYRVRQLLQQWHWEPDTEASVALPT